jgi:hypothetical protein
MAQAKLQRDPMRNLRLFAQAKNSSDRRKAKRWANRMISECRAFKGKNGAGTQKRMQKAKAVMIKVAFSFATHGLRGRA